MLRKENESLTTEVSNSQCIYYSDFSEYLASKKIQDTLKEDIQNLRKQYSNVSIYQYLSLFDNCLNSGIREEVYYAPLEKLYTDYFLLYEKRQHTNEVFFALWTDTVLKKALIDLFNDDCKFHSSLKKIFNDIFSSNQHELNFNNVEICIIFFKAYLKFVNKEVVNMIYSPDRGLPPSEQSTLYWDFKNSYDTFILRLEFNWIIDPEARKKFLYPETEDKNDAYESERAYSKYYEFELDGEFPNDIEAEDDKNNQPKCSTAKVLGTLFCSVPGLGLGSISGGALAMLTAPATGGSSIALAAITATGSALGMVGCAVSGFLAGAVYDDWRNSRNQHGDNEDGDSRYSRVATGPAPQEMEDFQPSDEDEYKYPKKLNVMKNLQNELNRTIAPRKF